jgi:hypothetical protein
MSNTLSYQEHPGEKTSVPVYFNWQVIDILFLV